MKEKTKKSKFKKGLLIYAVTVLVVIAGGLCAFWFFIKDYEEGMPVHGMEQVMQSFNETDIQKLIGDQTFGNAKNLEDASVWTSWYQELIKGKQMTFEEAKENTDTTPTYTVKADGQPVGKVILKVVGSNGFRFDVWGFDRLDASECLPDTAVYTITVPKKVKVSVNGHELGKEYIEKDDVTYSQLESIQTYLPEALLTTTYKVSGLLNTPKITASSVDGKPVILSQKEHMYTFSYGMAEEETAALKAMVESVANNYAMNFIDVSKQIYNDIMPGSELEENMKLTVTGFYPTKYISSYGFDSMNVSNFEYYSNECFSCDVHYNFHVNFQGFSVTEEVLPGNMKWYFVNKDGTWYLTNLEYLAEK